MIWLSALFSCIGAMLLAISIIDRWVAFLAPATRDWPMLVRDLIALAPIYIGLIAGVFLIVRRLGAKRP